MDKASTGAPQPSRATRRRPPRRGRYVYKACLECRRRKTKCSGEHPCSCCQFESFDCHYAAGPARTRKQGSKSHGTARLTTPEESISNESQSRRCIIQDQELGIRTIKSPTSILSATPVDNQCSMSLSHVGVDMTGISDNCSRKLVRSSSIVGRHVNDEECDSGLNRWNLQAKLTEVHNVRTMVRHYLIRVNPRVPFLNCGQQLHDVERLLAGKEEDRLQSIAQVELIMALLQIMTDETAGTDNPTPVGWRQFQTAENLLQRGSWQGISNLRTIQCLILKTMYLIYADRNDLAYDAVATIVRISFQLGLHNQECWALCSPFEVHLRQRILWTVFCMERHVVEACKLPCLLRQEQLEVPLPRHIDDGKLQSGLDVLPPEDPAAPIQHLYFSYQRAVLFTEIWDHRVLAIPSGDQTDEELLETIDARIHLLRAEMPRYLHWRSENIPRSKQVNQTRRFLIRESLVLHLLLNSLRLLLRKPWIDGNAESSPGIISDCIEIMTDSIHALHSYYQTDLSDPIERYTSARYLLDALYPLARIILHKSDLVDCYRRQAHQSFDIGLSLLKRFSSHLALACTALENIQPMVVKILVSQQECMMEANGHDLQLSDDTPWNESASLGGACETTGAGLEGIDTSSLWFLYTDSW